MHQIVHCFTPLAVVGAMTLAGKTLAQTPTQQRGAAVLRAHGGHMAEAQQALRALLPRRVDDGLVAMELATLLQQDGKPWEAISVFEKAASSAPPGYALLAATRAYRDLARFPEAEALAPQGARRFGIGEAELSTARDVKAVRVQIDPDGRHLVVPHDPER